MIKIENGGANQKAILVTVIYAGVFSYSFSFWDEVNADVIHIFYLFFVCALLIADWFAVYAKQSPEYNKTNFFLWDIAILFFISRVISTSTAEDNRCYWAFMSATFLFYALWDVIVGLRKILPDFQWRRNFIGDLSTTTIILGFLFYFSIIQREELPLPCWVHIILLTTCSLAVANWFKPLVSWFNKILIQSFITVKGLTRLFHRSN